MSTDSQSTEFLSEQLVTLAMEAFQHAKDDPEGTLAALLAGARELSDNTTQNPSHIDPAPSHLDSVLEDIDRRQEHPGIMGHSLGLGSEPGSLDDLLGGLEGGRVTTLLAAPATGKTTFSNQIAWTIASTGVPVLYVSYENEVSDLIKKTLARLAGVAMPAAAQGSHGQGLQLTAQLGQLNGSGASGTATVSVRGNEATVTIEAWGLSPNLPHAQHIHIGGQNTCPPPAAAGEDGLINTVEGQPFYGSVQVSLTTTGGVGADSALAVERFPVASANGTISYSRTFQLPAGVTPADMRNGVIVQHGISELFEDPTQYDGEPRSSLTSALPLEATIPMDCGKLMGPGN